jgi:omega-6 fatty acid desaturase (delta-12 desaturase)
VNDFWGEVTSMLVWTPYAYWRNEHARHHAGSGNLDRRGTGDIWTLTVEEYRKLSRFHRLRYRLYRHPLFLFGVAPLYVFTVGYRFWARWAGKTERLSVLRTNLVLLAMLALFHSTVGLKAFFMVQLPILALAASAGVWLFYVQHQFENVYWEKTDRWDFFTQAIAGSSFYKLPRWLAWCTANIGYHHVHHLSPGIPNYRLADCHRENAIFKEANRVTLTTSLKSLTFRLWDEETRKMVGFKDAA